MGKTRARVRTVPTTAATPRWRTMAVAHALQARLGLDSSRMRGQSRRGRRWPAGPVTALRRLVEDIARQRGAQRPHLAANVLEPLTERARGPIPGRPGPYER